MKHLIKMASLLFLICFFSGNFYAQSSRKLMVYDKTGALQSFSLNEVQKITFTNAEMVVSKNDGNALPILFSAFHYFNVSSDVTAIPEIKTPGSTVYFSNELGEVKARSLSKITELSLFDIQGRKLQQICPNSPEANLQLSSHPKGIYIVRAVDETGVTVKKIIKK
ncbi:MAG: T9SS type A sorting domain-containing protein [Candidatus Symbiothrix sp.]|nr:T9SS type A sorting domain-containing protein [Candidatus Symbiothrix sp.]